MPADPVGPNWRWTGRDLAILGLLVLAAVGARAGVIGHALERLDDPDGYLQLARSLVRGDGLQINGRLTAYRPPLYPIVLAPWVWLFDGAYLPTSLVGLQFGLGAATVAVVADLARRWGLPRSASYLAAVIAAFDPVLLVQSRTVMTETLAALLLAITLWALTLSGKRGALGGGIGFGLAALCRPSLLPAALLTALLGLGESRSQLVERFQRSSCLLGATFLVLLPWAARNAHVLGTPVWTTTHGGYTLALANNPAYYADVLNGPPGTVWSGSNQDAWIRSINSATAGLNEPESDRLLRSQAVDFARQHPRDFVRATGARLGRFWGVMPSASLYSPWLRWATAAWTTPVWILVAAGLFNSRAWQWPNLAAVASIVALTSVHSVYWTDLRMRAPLVPAFAVLAGVGVTTVKRWRFRKTLA